jgi:hexosaminidase
MVADWYDGLRLESEWTRPEGSGSGRYRLVLTNHGKSALKGFRLGFSGPMRVSADAVVTGGRVVQQLSNYCEIAPEPSFSLPSGASWTIDINKLDYPIRHWTDGATTAFVIRSDGSTQAVVTESPRLAGSDAVRRKGTMRMPVPERPPVPVSIVPWPKSVNVSGRRTVPHGFAVMAEDGPGEVVADTFGALTQFLFPGEGIVRSDDEGGYPVDCRFDEALGEEAYAIAFAPDGIEIAGGSESGLLYGLITLAQMQRGARLHPRSYVFPTGGSIVDAPAMRWRGCHLDVARRFYSSEEVKRFLAVMAWNKLNVFHWHLSDDEAWRVEIDAYPELTRHTAFRGYGMAIPPLLGSGPERTGGYYTKDAIRDIVDLAEDFGIDVVPEIDVPGHCYALLEALPELRDAGENKVYHSIQSFPNNCLNPANEVVYGALETIFGEMTELFPSRYFHVGADEVPADAWKDSPAANAMRATLGVTGTAPLQAKFLQRVQAFLKSKGKITGAWEEAAHGGGIDKAHSYLVGWQTVEASQKLAGEGYDVVAAPAQAFYLDMANGEDWHECGAAWAGWASPEKTYGFDPAAGWSESERKRLLGVQGCIWSEPMTDRAVFDRLVFPRLSAIAETGWTPKEAKSYARFTAAVGLMPNLYGQHEEA